MQMNLSALFFMRLELEMYKVDILILWPNLFGAKNNVVKLNNIFMLVFKLTNFSLKQTICLEKNYILREFVFGAMLMLVCACIYLKQWTFLYDLVVCFSIFIIPFIFKMSYMVLADFGCSRCTYNYYSLFGVSVC
jgi:hypothetical protein